MQSIKFKSELEKILGTKIKNPNLFITAFVHRSYLNESRDPKIKESNERLEFLGDAVLQFLTSELIYKKYPEFPEGQLTNLRSKLVNTDSLAEESKRLGLSKYVFVSKGEKETVKTSNYILADLFEAVLGALYLDSGITACRKYLTKELFYKCDDIVKNGKLKDAKSLYQEYAQDELGITPHYKLIKTEGPDHNKSFTVGLYLGNKLISEGTGPSKRKAERNAAQNALEKK